MLGGGDASAEAAAANLTFRHIALSADTAFLLAVPALPQYATGTRRVLCFSQSSAAADCPSGFAPLTAASRAAQWMPTAGGAAAAGAMQVAASTGYVCALLQSGARATGGEGGSYPPPGADEAGGGPIACTGAAVASGAVPAALPGPFSQLLALATGPCGLHVNGTALCVGAGMLRDPFAGGRGNASASSFSPARFPLRLGQSAARVTALAVFSAPGSAAAPAPVLLALTERGAVLTTALPCADSGCDSGSGVALAPGGTPALAGAPLGLLSPSALLDAHLVPPPLPLAVGRTLAAFSCGVTCDLRLSCWGPAGALASLAPPPHLAQPCALLPPSHVADAPMRVPLCVPSANDALRAAANSSSGSGGGSTDPPVASGNSSVPLTGDFAPPGGNFTNSSSSLSGDSGAPLGNSSGALLTPRDADVCEAAGLWAVYGSAATAPLANAFIDLTPRAAAAAGTTMISAALTSAGAYALSLLGASDAAAALLPGAPASLLAAFAPVAAPAGLALDAAPPSAQGAAGSSAVGGGVTLFAPLPATGASPAANDDDAAALPSVPLEQGLQRGELSADCSELSWDDGSLWRAVGRCPVQFLRVRAEPGTPLLALAALRVWDAEGRDMLPAATLAASSADAVLCGGDGGGAWGGGYTSPLVPPRQAAAAACAARLQNSSLGALPFVSGAGDGGVGGDGGPWLHIDLGVEVALSQLHLTRASAAVLLAAAANSGGAAGLAAAAALGAADAGALDAALLAAALNLTVEGYGAAAADAFAPVPAAASASDIRRAGVAPSFSLPLRAWAAAAADVAAATWAWRGLALSCGHLPLSSASPSATPSAAATQSPSSTPSGSPTPSGSAAGTPTASGSPTPTPTATPSATRSRSATATGSGSPPSSASPSATPSAAPTPAALLFRATLPLPSREEQEGAVAARIAAGLSGAFAQLPSAPVGVRAWLGVPGFTSLAPLPGATWSANLSRGAVAWEPFSDAGSGVAVLAVCFGTAPFACDAASWVAVDSALTVDGLAARVSVAPGSVLYGTVAAVNGVGLATLATSSGVALDDRPPLLGRVLDTGAYFLDPAAGGAEGTVVGAPSRPRDIDCDGAGRGVGASWTEGGVAGAGVAGYAWSVGSSPGAADVLPWTGLGVAAAVYNASLNPPRGATVYASVRAFGVAGGVAEAHSNGVRMLDDGDSAGEGARLLCVALPV